jgi:hypothetical protein
MGAPDDSSSAKNAEISATYFKVKEVHMERIARCRDVGLD